MNFHKYALCALYYDWIVNNIKPKLTFTNFLDRFTGFRKKDVCI